MVVIKLSRRGVILITDPAPGGRLVLLRGPPPPLDGCGTRRGSHGDYTGNRFSLQ